MRTSLKFAKGESLSVNGIAEIEITVPGIPVWVDPTSQDGRFVSGGQGWFENPLCGDLFIVEIQDPGGNVVGSYADVDVPAINSGWYIPKHIGHIEVSTLNLLGWIPAGMILVIRATRSDLANNDIFRCNIRWGKDE